MVLMRILRILKNSLSDGVVFDATGFGGVILDGIKSLSNKSSRTQQELPIKANSIPA